jgi:chorismate mutase/prephenate dehydratase
MAKKKPKSKSPKKQETGAESIAAALADLRTRINALDAQLVKILNERCELVVEVGRHKRSAGLPVYAPHREAEVLERAIRESAGPLPERTLEAIYRELMSGSFTLQQPMRIGFLGPAGSHSHVAAVRQFGSSVAFENLHDISGVFTEVQRGHVHYGLVPIENSTGGGIAETLDAFRDGHAHKGRGEVSVCAEVQLAVHHAFLGNTEPGLVRRIFSKPEVFTQCRVWLARQYPNAELVAMPSSSRAAESVAEESAKAGRAGRAPDVAAIGSELAGQIYGLNVLFANIEDNPDNITRFFVIGRQLAVRTGDDKTTIMFTTADKPGALVHVLQAFERYAINLTHIEKRPSGKRNWTYTFFVDAQGHRDDEGMSKALAEAKSHCRELAVLGSYPRAKRIL